MTGSSRVPDAAWRDSRLDLEARVAALMADLTDDEQAQLALADWAPLTSRNLPHLHYMDSGNGLRGVPGATSFPVGIAQAASFDPALVTEVAAAVGAELRAAAYTVLLGPTVDLARDPRGGRIPEGFGEDSYLSSVLGAAHVRGVQSNAVIAMVKHYVAYNGELRRTGWGAESDRGPAVDVHVDRAALEDAYFLPFRAVVAAGAWSLMGSYNRVEGTYVCENRRLLDIPRDEWGFRGIYAPDFKHAVRDPAAALAAGLDVPGLEGAAGRTRAMLDANAGSARMIAERVVRALLGSGLVDSPVGEAAPPSAVEHRELARRAAVAGMVLLRNEDAVLPLTADLRSVAVIGPAGADAMFTLGGSAGVDVVEERFVTPLDGVRARAGDIRVLSAQGSYGDAALPLVPAEAFTLPDRSGPGVLLERVAADGRARSDVLPALDWTATAEDLADGWPRRWTTYLASDRTGPHRLSLMLAGYAVVRLDGRVVLAGAREVTRFIAGPSYPLQALVHLEAGVPVLLEVEFEVGPSLFVPPVGWAPEIHLGWQQPDALLEEAAAAAAAADVAVVLVNAASGEGMDRDGLELPGDQDALVARVAAANPRTVVVLNTPGAVLTPWLDDVAALLQVWYPGEQFGAALASVLFGDEEPGGRLPLTFPRDRSHLPGGDLGPADAPTELRYDEGVAIGYRSPAVGEHGALFPFGHGLGYAVTRHEVLGADVVDDEVRVRVRVTNESDRDSVHVVQAYVELGGVADSAALAALARVPVAAGGTADAVVGVGPDAFLRYDARAGRRVVVDGTHRLRLAHHSADPGSVVSVDVAGRPVAGR